MRPHLLPIVTGLVLSLGSDALAQNQFHNEQGQVVIGASLGIGVGDRTVVAGGVGVGYAVVTGVLPGVRGLVIADQGVGGEVAATLTLSPPLSLYTVPFITGEAGRRFEPNGSGWLYGAGGGVFIGEPQASYAIQVGWMFRRIAFSSVTVDASGPIIAISIRL